MTMTVRLMIAVFGVVAVAIPVVAQMPSTAPATSGATVQPASAAGAGLATGDFQPALGPVRQALGDLRLDRWKLSKSLRDQTESDVSSIKRDLEGTLPGLLATADSAPATVSSLLPVANNASALYDVLLRVTERAKVAAPPNQMDELVQAQSALEGARRSFADRVLKAAVAEEQQVSSLKLAAKPVVAAACAPVPAVASSSTAKTTGKKKKKVMPATGSVPAKS